MQLEYLLTHLLHAEDEGHLLAAALPLDGGGHLVVAAEAAPPGVPPLLLQAVHLPGLHQLQNLAGQLLAERAVEGCKEKHSCEISIPLRERHLLHINFGPEPRLSALHSCCLSLVQQNRNMQHATGGK